MAVRQIKAVGGLVTDPGSLDKPEQLKTADNVLLHREGVIQPRIGFGDTTDIASRSTDFRPIAIVPYSGDLVIQSIDGSNYRLEKGSANTVYSTTVTPPDASSFGVSSFFQARKSLYVETTTGLQKLTSPAASGLSASGLDASTAFGAIADTGGGTEPVPLADNTAVALRFVFVKEDANGYIRRSAPSPRYVVGNTGAAWHPNMAVIILPTYLAAGDTIELYRSRAVSPATATPSDELFLSQEYTVTSADIANGWATIQDFTAENSLGPALYTNPSFEGIGKANALPPIARATAYWSDVAWFGNTTQRHKVRVKLYDVGGVLDFGPGGTVYNTTGIQFRTFTADIASGTNTLLNVSSTAGLVVGMALWDNTALPYAAGTYFPANTTIVSIVSTTITMSANATATAVGRETGAGDTITVAGQKLFAAAALSAVYDATNRVFPVSQAADENTRRRATAYGLAYVVNSYSSTRALVTALTDAETGGLEGVITFTEVGIGGGGFTISSTRPDAFQPSLGVSGIASEAERKPHRIYYSKPSEPEAVPFLNFLDIGQEGADILALAPLRDAVLLFKEDGVYSVEGTPPDSWNVRKLDLGTRLVAPQAACVLDDVCYAWTDRGVVQVSAGGVVGIPSLPIGVTLRELQRLLPANDANTKRGFWMRPHPRLGLVVLGTGTLASSTTASQQFVFHTTTGRWARWTIDLRCAAYDTETDSMVVSRNVAAWNAYYERSAESSPASYVDASLLDLSGSVDGTGLVVTIAKTAFGAFTPATGDVLVDGDDHVQRVLSVVSSGSNWAITCDLGLEGSVFDWYQSYGSTVQWLATVAPGVGSRWQEMHVHLAPSQSQPSAYVTSYPMVLGGASDITNGATVTATVSNALAVESKPIRVGVHRNIVRNTHLYPSLSVNTAGVLWRISEVDLHGTGQSQRVAR